jgi:hypothetical protein
MQSNLRSLRMVSTLFVAAFAVAGCDINVSGSGGPSTSDSSEADTLSSGRFKTVYTTWLEFDRDLTIGIDNMLAQVESGNEDATAEARRYFNVGLDVLQRQHGISFSSPSIEARSNDRSIRLRTEQSGWIFSTDWPASSMPSGIKNRDTRLNVRWRARIPGAVLSFNTVQPKKIDIYAVLEIEIQEEASPGVWRPARLRPYAVRAIQSQLAGLMTTAYGNYLKTRFAVNTDSPQFRGIHALSTVSDAQQ